MQFQASHVCHVTAFGVMMLQVVKKSINNNQSRGARTPKVNIALLRAHATQTLAIPIISCRSFFNHRDSQPECASVLSLREKAELPLITSLTNYHDDGSG